MPFTRSSGILLHPTSLPGKYGIGELGPEAFRWLEWLAESGTSLWQVLPLGPTGYGDSPYQSFSAFAGNPYLVSVEYLLRDGLLLDGDLEDMPESDPESIDFGAIYNWKPALLDKAYDRYKSTDNASLSQEIAIFRNTHQDWLEDYALFMALKDAHGGNPWGDWPKPLRLRDPETLARARKTHRSTMEKHIFRQFLFFRQWVDVKNYANEKGIKIIGDIPIFVALDSADVWANPELFFIDEDGQPTVVAGVPPDYFSVVGQLWGNPLYRWDVHAESGYAWWIARFRAVLGMVDIVRLDHFRGFVDYWEIPADAETAVKGVWKDGPGESFFINLRNKLGELPIIAEDLGEINPLVYVLRDKLDLPGMKILVFSFADEPDNLFLPHNYSTNCVVYTGTHDNDTVLGWYKRVDEKERDFTRRYLARSGEDISWDLMRLGWGSVAVFALAQMQDVLSLDNDARMNYPGSPSGNWTWRMREDALNEGLKNRLRDMNYVYGRLSGESSPNLNH